MVAQCAVARRAPVRRGPERHGLAGEPWHIRRRRFSVSLGSANDPKQVVLFRNHEAPPRVASAGTWPVLLHDVDPADVALARPEADQLRVSREPRPPAAQLVEAGAPQPASVVRASGAASCAPTSPHPMKIRPRGARCKASEQNQPISRGLAFGARARTWPRTPGRGHLPPATCRGPELSRARYERRRPVACLAYDGPMLAVARKTLEAPR